MIGAIFRAIRHKYLNLTFRSGDGYLVRIVERPGRWMDRAALGGLSDQLRQIAGRTLASGDLHYGVFSGDAASMENVIITLICRRDGVPIAFNALAVMQVDTQPQPTEVLHLGLVMVDPDERSKNLSWLLYGLTCFLIFVRRQFRPLWVSNVTQVPAVVGMVAEMFSNVWPAPGSGRRSLNHLLLGRGIMSGHRVVFGVGPEAGFDEDGFVITNAYTGGSDDLRKSWEAAPKHRDAQFNTYCADRLDYARGDDLLQLGQMDMAAMRRYLGREVPKSALVGLVLTAGLVGLRRVFLPVLHWADAGQQWSILRPWAVRRK
ncbi:hypothetical protein [Yoonia sp. SS1-5]|uniref:Uncharacterized protein n=1 Tax=Yoonia rhodophyticola TaxID=3137370 RepID=A0AAN0M832_9RHOB